MPLCQVWARHHDDDAAARAVPIAIGMLAVSEFVGRNTVGRALLCRLLDPGTRAPVGGVRFLASFHTLMTESFRNSGKVVPIP